VWDAVGGIPPVWISDMTFRADVLELMLDIVVGGMGKMGWEW
jgi:hypothetical protein